MLEDERKLIEQAKDGEAEAFGSLYDHYLPKIYRFVLLKVSHREEAEDLTHQAFLKAWENIGGFSYEGKYENLPFGSWLYRIARNTIVDHYRSSSKAKTDINIDEVVDVLPDTNDNTNGKGIEVKIDQKISLRQISDALIKLKDVEQDVIIMRFVDDLPHEEVAKVIGKSVGATKLIQHRALGKIRQSLETQES